MQPLRPKAMRSKPVFMDKVFDDPAHIMRLIQTAGPFKTLSGFYGIKGGSVFDTQPLFRHDLDDDVFIHNPHWIAAAKQAFGAEIVHPFKCLLNISAPMDELSVHTDLPSFRGFTPSVQTKDILQAMINSGLFFDWMAPFASGLAWFYRGEGGEFIYWDNGTSQAPHIARPPFWNVGVMSDNEAMFHAVAAVGSPTERANLGNVTQADMLHHVGDARWEIRDETRVAARLDGAKLRISLLWKARVFRDAAHLASFENPAFDLTPPVIADVFLHDLADKGVSADPPGDPLHPAWQAFLMKTYPQPFQAATADVLGA